MRHLTFALPIALVFAACASPGFRATPTFPSAPLPETSDAPGSQPTSGPSSQPSSQPSSRPSSAPSSQPSTTPAAVAVPPEVAEVAEVTEVVVEPPEVALDQISASLVLAGGMSGTLRARLQVAYGEAELEDADLEEVCARPLADEELVTLRTLIEAVMGAEPVTPPPSLGACMDCLTYQIGYRVGGDGGTLGGQLESLPPSPEALALLAHLQQLRTELLTACQPAQ